MMVLVHPLLQCWGHSPGSRFLGLKTGQCQLCVLPKLWPQWGVCKAKVMAECSYPLDVTDLQPYAQLKKVKKKKRKNANEIKQHVTKQGAKTLRVETHQEKGCTNFKTRSLLTQRKLLML